MRYDEVYLDEDRLFFFNRYIQGNIRLANVSWRSLIFGYAMSMSIRSGLKAMYIKMRG